jgi:hypothetical protein
MHLFRIDFIFELFCHGLVLVRVGDDLLGGPFRVGFLYVHTFIGFRPAGVISERSSVYIVIIIAR